MTTHRENRRKRANAASNARASAAKARLQTMKPAWWALLFDMARGAGWASSPRTMTALARRQFVTLDGERWVITHAGYFALMGRRRDPIADIPPAEVAAYYLTLRDAPAWPKETE